MKPEPSHHRKKTEFRATASYARISAYSWTHGREPTFTELAIFSAHVERTSVPTSRQEMACARCRSEGPKVICGPGEKRIGYRSINRRRQALFSKMEA